MSDLPLVESIETPALLLDLDAFEGNLNSMVQSMKPYPNIKIRPHFKAHKCVWIAKAQEKALNAVGFCCQKVSEAEALMKGGLLNVYLSNEVVSPVKLRRVMKTAQETKATLSFCVDSVEGVGFIEAAAAEVGLGEIGCLVDCNVGQNRCGVSNPEEALRVAQEIAKAPHLVFKGIQVYQGNAQHIRPFVEREQDSKDVAAKAKKIIALLTQHGLKVEIVTGGGTGTYHQDAAAGVFTEIQPGSFIFNDVDYSQNLDATGGRVSTWRQSLFLLGSVMSRTVTPTERWCVLDAGQKAHSLDSGNPVLRDYQAAQATFQNGGDEHSKVIFLDAELPMPRLNDKVFLIPGHCDPTVNMHPVIYAVRGAHVDAVHLIEAHGPGI